MLNTLIIGGGRAGLGLHWPVLRSLRVPPDQAGLWPTRPPVVHDVRDIGEARAEGLTPAHSLADAARLADPAATVVHLCTPPGERPADLGDLAALGYTRILVEKPVAAAVTDLDAVDTLARRHRLTLRVVSPWLAGSLTRELEDLVRYGTLGALRSLSFTQCKPRWTRTVRAGNHPTAFQVELPHSLGVALRLAGDAEVTGADLTDMRIGDTGISHTGGARLTLAHHNGVTTEIVPDLTSPVRERRIGLRCAAGEAVGHYPVSDVDHHASLTAPADGGKPRIRHDDALTRYIDHAYRDFRAGRGDRAADGRGDYSVARRVVQLLHDAQALATARDARAPAPDRSPRRTQGGDAHGA